MMIKSLYSLAITETIPVFTDEGIYINARLASIEVYTTENLHDDMVVVDRCLFEANHIGTTRLLDITNNYHIFMTKLRANFSASAGIQEEVSSPGEPVLFMRDATERSERFEAGILRLVGTNEDTSAGSSRACWTTRRSTLSRPMRPTCTATGAQACT